VRLSGDRWCSAAPARRSRPRRVSFDIVLASRRPAAAAENENHHARDTSSTLVFATGHDVDGDTLLAGLARSSGATSPVHGMRWRPASQRII
jgi:hypothetical protein